jgi:methionyl-tRNA formyltransferase
MRPRVVFLGSRVLGKFALKFLASRNDIDLIGKVVLDDYSNEYWNEDPADISWPPTIKYEKLSEIDFDLGISVNYWKIVRPPILDKPKMGFYNIHHSYNLMYRGVNINTFAILEARKNNRWYHGTTLHRMAENVDAGDIVSSMSCPITELDTAFTLFCKVEALCRDLIVEWFPRLWSGEVALTPPSPKYKTFMRRDMISRHLRADWDALNLYDHVRALTFPPFERPYIIPDDRKVHLTILPQEGERVIADAGSGRIVYEKRDFR